MLRLKIEGIAEVVSRLFFCPSLIGSPSPFLFFVHSDSFDSVYGPAKLSLQLGLPIRFMLALKKDSRRLPDTCVLVDFQSRRRPRLSLADLASCLNPLREMFDGLDFFYERNSVKIGALLARLQTIVSNASWTLRFLISLLFFSSMYADRQNSFFCGNAAGRPGDYGESVSLLSRTVLAQQS